MASPAEHVVSAASQLARAGWSEDDARTDAAVLARSILGWDAAQWLVHQREPAPPAFAGAFSRAIERRLTHEPVAYITGTREFYGRDFEVTPAVLIPRPETEWLVEAAIASARHHPSPLIVDIGTGSGCIAVAIALECPDARVIATDASAAALGVASRNAARLGAGDRVTFIHGRWLDGIAEPIDIIVSNPPYIAESDRTTLPADVVNFEPALALFGGDDGLASYRVIAPLAADRLVPGGTLLLEIGAEQEAMVSDLLTSAGLQVETITKDLQGIPRVIIAKKSSSSF